MGWGDWLKRPILRHLSVEIYLGMRDQLLLSDESFFRGLFTPFSRTEISRFLAGVNASVRKRFFGSGRYDWLARSRSLLSGYYFREAQSEQSLGVELDLVLGKYFAWQQSSSPFTLNKTECSKQA